MTIDEETGPESHLEMTCTEIIGGIEATEKTVKCPGLDVWIRSRPWRNESTGGDVHYVSLCGGGVITRMLLGDVSGHGEHVREYALELRRLVKRHIVRKSQRRFMRDLNRNFAEYANLRRFATAVVLTYLSYDRSMEMCIAGHPRPAVHYGKTGRWSFLGEGLASGAVTTAGVTNMPIGVDEGFAFESFRIALEPGDVMVLYTDAITEALSPSGELLGEAGLAGILESIDPPGLAPGEIGQRILARASEFRGNRPSEDDETVIVLRHNGDGPRRAGMGERVEALAKLLRIKDF